MAPNRPPNDSPEVAALAAQLDRLGAELVQWQSAMKAQAEPTLRRALLALDYLCDVAETPSHPGSAQARQLVTGWVQTYRRAEAVAAGIVVPPANGGPGGR